MPEICENWLGLVNSCIYYAYQTLEIYQVLPYAADFKAPLESKTVFSKCSFIWYKGPVNIWLDCKAQNYLNIGPVKTFLIF